MADDLKLGRQDAEQAVWLARMFERGVKFDHSQKQWHKFDPKTGIWVPDKTRRVDRQAVLLTHRRIHEIADLDLGKQERSDADATARRILNRQARENALYMLAEMEDYATDGDDWDQKPALLGVGNGVVDLTKNRLVPMDPANLVTKTTGHKFEPLEATEETFWRAAFERAPHFVTFLDQVTSKEGLTMGRFLLKWFGYSMFGFTMEHHYLIMVGSGRNGKGTLATAMRMVFGEYSAPPETQVYMKSKLGATPSASARADLMVLKGKRLAIMEEPEGGEFNEDLLKAHSGNSPITARWLYSNKVSEWQPTHSITFLTNYKPKLTDIGPSMQDRVMVADFRERYEGAARDLGLEGKLEAEAEGIQAILVWCAQDWFAHDSEHGMVLPDRVREASREYIEANDPVGDALREVFQVGPGMTGRSQVCYDTYVDWHDRSGVEGRPMSSVAFAQTLESKGFRKTKVHGTMIWKGIRPLSAMEVADGEAET